MFLGYFHQDCFLPVLRRQRLWCRGEQRSLVRRRLDGLDGQLRRDGHGGRGSEGGLQLRHRHLDLTGFDLSFCWGLVNLSRFF